MNTLIKSKKLSIKFVRGLISMYIMAFVLAYVIQSCTAPIEMEPITERQQVALSSFEGVLFNESNKIEKTLTDLSTRSSSSDQYDPGITEDGAKELLSPIFEEGSNLLNAYGFTVEELEESFGSLDSPEIVSLALTIVRVEELNDQLSNNIEQSTPFPFYSTAYAQSIKDCALRAIGVDRLIDWAKGKYLSSYAARKMLIKAVGKAAARLGLGWIGTALAVAEFVECMAH